MSERCSYLALDDDQRLVVEWFSNLKHEVTVSDNADRTVYYFRDMASATLVDPESLDQTKAPLVFLYKPQLRCGTLRTDAEVIFTPTPFRSQFPKLHRVNVEFARWLNQFDLVYSQQPHGAASNWDYYLEGGIRNFDSQIFALPSALNALRSGQYFVHYNDSPRRLETVCRSLRLRGYATSEAS